MSEKLTDMQAAIELANHLRAPCTVEVQGRLKNIRAFYLRLAREMLSDLEKKGTSNPAAVDFLRLEIQIAEGALKEDEKS
jgi:hypothetical protein